MENTKKTNKNSYLGIDISDSSIKISELAQIGDKYSVISKSNAKFEKDTVQDWKIINKVNFQKTLKQALDLAKPSFVSKKAVISIPESNVFFFTLDFPINTNPKQIDSFITDKLAEIEKVNEGPLYTFKSQSSLDKFIHLEFYFTDRANLNSINHELELAQLEIIGITPVSLSLGLNLIKDEVDQGTLFVDIGSELTGIYIIDQKGLSYSTTIPFAGDKLDQFIAEALKISEDDARIIKT